METQDRHIGLDRQRYHRKHSAEKGQPSPQCDVFNILGADVSEESQASLTTPLFLVTENRVREKGGPDPLCSCAPGYIAMLRGRFVSVLGFDLGLYSSLWVE